MFNTKNFFLVVLEDTIICEYLIPDKPHYFILIDTLIKKEPLNFYGKVASAVKTSDSTFIFTYIADTLRKNQKLFFKSSKNEIDNWHYFHNYILAVKWTFDNKENVRKLIDIKNCKECEDILQSTNNYRLYTQQRFSELLDDKKRRMNLLLEENEN